MRRVRIVKTEYWLKEARRGKEGIRKEDVVEVK